MIDNNKVVTVVNRYSGSVGYNVPDMNNLHRNFVPGERKQVTYEELFKLASYPAGQRILKNYLVIKDYDVIKELFGEEFEPEYFYTEEDIENLMVNGTLDEFLDCLDYAPDGVIDILKNLAVDLPLNDVSKRNAIKAKTGFNVDAAIRVKETKYDGDPEGNFDKEQEKPQRRAAVPAKKAVPGAGSARRAATPTVNK